MIVWLYQLILNHLPFTMHSDERLGSENEQICQADIHVAWQYGFGLLWTVAILQSFSSCKAGRITFLPQMLPFNRLPPPSRYRFFPNTRGGVSGFGVPPSRRPAAQEQAGGGLRGRHNWGQGVRLGDDWERTTPPQLSLTNGWAVDVLG